MLNDGFNAESHLVYTNVLHTTSIYQAAGGLSERQLHPFINDDYDDNDDSCKSVKQTIKILNTTVPLVWLIIGTLTNGLSLFVFSRPALRRSSTFFYLATMTLSDFVVIWISSFRDFLVYKFHIYVNGSLTCRIHVFLFFLTCQFSSWLLTAANFDRLVFVISYKHSKLWCTKRTAIKLTCTLLFILVLINFHFLLFVNSNENFFVNETNHSAQQLPTVNQFVYPYCLLKQNGYDEFYLNYYSWIDAFVYSYIPFIIMCVCNIALIQKVFTTKRNIHRGTSSKYNSGESKRKNQNSFRLSLIPNHNQELKAVKMNSGVGVGGGVNANGSDSIDRIRNMAITIIGVTFLFIIFTLPINIYVPIVASSSSHNPNTKSHCDDILFCILNNMVNANHAINFFIYLATNSKFKKEINTLFARCKLIIFVSDCLDCSKLTRIVVNDDNLNNEKNKEVKTQKSKINMIENGTFIAGCNNNKNKRAFSYFGTVNLDNSMHDAKSDDEVEMLNQVSLQKKVSKSSQTKIKLISQKSLINEKKNQTATVVVVSDDQANSSSINQTSNDAEI